ETHLSLRQQQQRDRAVIILHHPLMRQREPGPPRGPHPPLFAPVGADDAAVLAPAERRPVKARRRLWPHHLRHVVGIEAKRVGRRRLVETALARPREPLSARPPPRSRPLHAQGSYRSWSGRRRQLTTRRKGACIMPNDGMYHPLPAGDRKMSGHAHS